MKHTLKRKYCVCLSSRVNIPGNSATVPSVGLYIKNQLSNALAQVDQSSAGVLKWPSMLLLPVQVTRYVTSKTAVKIVVGFFMNSCFCTLQTKFCRGKNQGHKQMQRSKNSGAAGSGADGEPGSTGGASGDGTVGGLRSVFDSRSHLLPTWIWIWLYFWIVSRPQAVGNSLFSDILSVLKYLVRRQVHISPVRAFRYQLWSIIGLVKVYPQA